MVAMSDSTPHLVDNRDTKQDDQGQPESGADRPPIEGMNTATKLVYVVLEREGELSASEVAAQTRLSVTTVRRRLAQLNGTGHVRSRPNIHNPTEYIHSLVDDGDDGDEDTDGDRHA